MVIQNRAALLGTLRELQSIAAQVVKDGANFTDSDVVSWLRKRDDFRARANECYILKNGVAPPEGVDWMEQESVDFPTSAGWRSAQQAKTQQKLKP